MRRDDWLDLARKVDWELSYVSAAEAFPTVQAGPTSVPPEVWRTFDEPFRTSFGEYVRTQHEKDAALYAIRDAVGRADDHDRLPPEWRSVLLLHAATLPLAEFAAVVGQLRAARFGRDSAWRTSALLGALDELRHAQIPLLLHHELVATHPSFDWTHRFYHSEDWVAVAARHLFDELLLGTDATEYAVATNFVFETGFTNLQFVALSALAHGVRDRMFEAMLQSIQSDEARHAQIGNAVLERLVAHDPAYAQRLVDKWFWRCWLLFAVLTGLSMDYLTPLEHRSRSFKEYVEEWVLDQFLRSLEAHGLAKPWYWDTFLSSLDHYHHMVYASAYTYRASVWFDMVVPGPRERAWLRQKYPRSWDTIDPVWERITQGWQRTDAGNDFGVHGTAIPTFCDLCQLVLCGGTPSRNTARVRTHGDRKYIFCSEPCQRIFEDDLARYAGHRGIVQRVLDGTAPGNLVAMITDHFGLDYSTWGKDARGGVYPWLVRERG